MSAPETPEQPEVPATPSAPLEESEPKEELETLLRDFLLPLVPPQMLQEMTRAVADEKRRARDLLPLFQSNHAHWHFLMKLALLIAQLIPCLLAFLLTLLAMRSIITIPQQLSQAEHPAIMTIL